MATLTSVRLRLNASKPETKLDKQCYLCFKGLWVCGIGSSYSSIAVELLGSLSKPIYSNEYFDPLKR